MVQKNTKLPDFLCSTAGFFFQCSTAVHPLFFLAIPYYASANFLLQNQRVLFVNTIVLSAILITLQSTKHNLMSSCPESLDSLTG